MATSKSSARTAKRRKVRRWPWALLVLFFLVAVGWWAYGDTIRGNADVGSAYAARVACSCRYVAGRSLEDCEKDKLAGMELITLSQDAEEQSVTASMPPIASHTARYREGYGCVLDKWEG